MPDVIIDLIGSRGQNSPATDEQITTMLDSMRLNDCSDEAVNLISQIATHCYQHEHEFLTKFFNAIDVNNATVFTILCCLRTSFPRRDLIEGWKPLLIRAYNHFKTKGEDVDAEFTGLTQYVDKTLLNKS